MSAFFAILTSYLLRLLPGLICGGILIFLTRKQPRLRILIYPALFILFRDTMTPLDLWSLGREGFFWMRFLPSPGFLITFSVFCLTACFLLYKLDKDNRSLLVWLKGKPSAGVILGTTAAFLAAAPLLAVYLFTPIEQRGGGLPLNLLPAIFLIAFFGNLLEEMLFRGYIFGYFEKKIPPGQTILLSGVIFSFCHIFLSASVTDIGYPILLFTLWEGILADLVRSKFGIAPAAITHGGAIFLIASGII